MFQVIVKGWVHLEDTENVFQGQCIWVADDLLCECLHYSIGTESEAFKGRQEKEQLNRIRKHSISHIMQQPELYSSPIHVFTQLSPGSCISLLHKTRKTIVTPVYWSIYLLQSQCSLRCQSAVLSLCSAAPYRTVKLLTIGWRGFHGDFLKDKVWEL